MCLGVPAKVLKIDKGRALVDVMGASMYVGIVFVPEVQVNDYVLLHAGQAMTIVDEKFAKESMDEWRDVMNGTPNSFS
ncbi:MULTISPECIES: HypC/HybG/HupF family hydrogenase formation chaperone [Lysinibacillus]|uniref:HypC/HybG/HupF family hydrogenase formation chaperone n=1 Tax=Lysinibacillus antri TaxID=2498145 RepID=A0A432L804_9BACI|nr:MULTISPECIES: HypC/HybG/HupF family hydrogenase formation chaperone [Lysinibacillus]RUL48635.1 HypC/HybG/HupF family hydrogenase formation chaperone [Lysinibacillus antri]TSI09706.1 HypC/HybG/HupF family hydrogenase formation chaperone [Lysinibacillus sp. BW-2-10]